MKLKLKEDRPQKKIGAGGHLFTKDRYTTVPDDFKFDENVLEAEHMKPKEEEPVVVEEPVVEEEPAENKEVVGATTTKTFKSKKSKKK